MRVLVVDTETGGLDPKKHSLLSIGAVWLEEGGTLGKRFRVNITYPEYIVTSEALTINKIDLTQHSGIREYKAFEEFVKFLDLPTCDCGNKEKIVLAGNNVHFDASFLRAWLSPWFGPELPFFSHRYLDLTTLIYQKYFSGEWKETLNLQGVLDHYGLTNEAPHTALGDAVATAKALSMMLYGHVIELSEELF
jgi:DNA polymerase III epsilon subunit-like protein